MTLLTSPAALLLLRTTLLLGLALLAVRLLRGPAVQTLAGRAALAAVALLLLTAPLTRFVPPLWHVPAPATPRPAAPVVVLTPTALPPLDRSDTSSKKWAGPVPLTLPVPNPPFREDPAKQGGRSLTPAPHPSTVVGTGGPLLLLWAAGTVLLLLWLAACQIHLTRLHRRAVLLTDGPAYDALTALTPNPPRLLACPGIDGPFLAGLVRPTIYLPADHAATFSPDALRAVLAHELAHASRRDTRWTLASRLLCALLWFQPLLWLLCRHLDHLSEDACDLAVLSQACPPRVYADCLLTLAERRPQSRRTSPLTAGLVPFRSQLARRVQHILTVKGNPPMPAVTRRLRFALPAAAVLAALGGTLLIAAPKEVHPPILSHADQPEKNIDGNHISLRSILYYGNKRLPDSDQTSLTEAQLLAGLTPVQGPGIIVTLNDSKKRHPNMPAGFAAPNLIHDTDIAAVVNELKASGAEAISINGQRLIVTTAIRSVGPTILINYTPQTPPYVVKAIGSPEALMTQINLPDGVAKQLRAYDPAMLSAQKADTLTLPAYVQTVRRQYDTATALSSLARTDFVAGLTPVQGPGIIVTLNDSKKPSVAMPAGFTPPNLIHDSDINAVVNELKASGAEAISINGQRLVATSPIRGGGPAILINDTAQAAPFVIQALGNPKTLLAGIELPGGVTKYLRAYDPAMLTTKVSPKPLLLPAYTATTTPRYAKPAPTNKSLVTTGKSTAMTSTLRYFVPKTGTHHVWLFVTNDTGRHLVFQKDCPPGTQIVTPIPTKGKTIVYRLYDYGKLIQSGLLTPANQQGSMKPVSAAQIASLQAERDRVQKLLLPLYRNYDAAKSETAALNENLKRAERQRTALGQANPTFAALQELDVQSARAQLTILRNNDAGLSQNNRPAKRQLSVLAAHRRKLARTLTPPQRQSFESKSLANSRVRFFLGLQLAQYQVKQDAAAAQISDMRGVLKSLNAQISEAQAH